MKTLTNTQDVEFPGSRTQQGKDTQDSLDLVNQYWEALSDRQKSLVLKVYEKDFQLLGYTKVGESGFPYLIYQDELENL